VELGGEWDKRFDCIAEHLAQVDPQIQDTIGKWPTGPVKDAATQIYNNLGAMAGTILHLCKTQQPHCSSQAVGALLRPLIEAFVSVLAFCEDPKNRAEAYLGFSKVLRYRLFLGMEKSIGCPYVPHEDGQRIRDAKHSVKAVLAEHGASYIKLDPSCKKAAADVLLEALVNDNAKVFTHNWYGGSVAKVLGGANMQWVHDFLYTDLCSSVHSDVFAGEFFAAAKRATPAWTALQIWGAGIYRFTEALDINLPPDQKGFLKKYCWDFLQCKPPPPEAPVAHGPPHQVPPAQP
jgi:hypothetical protein